MYAAWDVSLDDIAVGGATEPMKERKDSEGKSHFEWKDSEGVSHDYFEDTIQWTDSDGKLHQKALNEPSSWIESMFKRWDLQDPELTFPNCVKWSKKEVKWLRVVECNEEGKNHPYKYLSPLDIRKLKDDKSQKKVRIILAEETQGWFEENFKLHDFPYDLQHLHIAVTSRWDHKTVRIAFDEIRGTQKFSEVLTDQTWKMHQPRLFSYKQDWRPNSRQLLGDKETSATGKQYCRAYLALTVLRRSRYVMNNIMFILTLVGTMSFVAFANKIAKVNDRQQIILILVLTTVTFKYITMDMTPDIPYLTMIDYMIYGTMVLQILMLLCISLSVLFDEPATFDYICGIVLAFIWFGLLLYCLLKCLYMNWYRHQYVTHFDKIFDDYGKGNSGKPKILPEPNWCYWFNGKSKHESRYLQNSADREITPYFSKDTCVSLGVILLIALGLCGYLFIQIL